MGSIAELPVNGCGISWSKNRVEPSITTLFQENDRRTVRDSDDYEQVSYAATAAAVMDRLDILGFTAENAKGKDSLFLSCKNEGTPNSYLDGRKEERRNVGALR